MFTALFKQFTSLPFFSSLPFAILAMIIQGASWCIIGFILGAGPKKGLKSEIFMLFSYFFAIAVSIITMLSTEGLPDFHSSVFWLVFLLMFVSGFANIGQLLLMSKAMQYGPNGAIWAIVQSACIVPFIAGIVFFDVKLTPWGFIGLAFLITALVCYALTNDTRSTGPWRLLAFASLACTAIQQTLSTVPSYFENAGAISGVVRTLMSATGALALIAIFICCNWNHQYASQIKSNIASPRLWKYVIVNQAISLLLCYLLLYPGLDVMGSHGLGSISYPLMVCSCILAFTLTAVTVLKEKMTLIQGLALTCCTLGLLCLCHPASPEKTSETPAVLVE